jgi:beta-glucosidase
MAQFPEGFLWGAATAAYQIEGAIRDDGRGESIWDRFSATPGKIRNNESGKVADDHYHRYREDVQLMQELGLQAYRFSIAWPRILPNGRGRVNAAGLDFYERLVDALLAANIQPFATLYHWDLPQALQDDFGGWASRDTSKAFAEYVDVVSRRLSDRVHHWITLNEPQVSATHGYREGSHAPGMRDERMAWQVSHNLLLAHGLAVPVLRANGGSDSSVGITLNLTPIHPFTDRDEDRDVAYILDGETNRWYLDPVLRGTYPGDILDLLEQRGLAPQVLSGDAEAIAAPIDFLGINNYFRLLVRKKVGAALPWSYEVVPARGVEHTTMGWEVYPQGLRELLVRLHKEYAVPRIYVTENGAAFADAMSADGRVHDPRRLNFLHDYLEQAQAAIGEGAPLAGYFVWSLMDNFEWAQGYSQRFGIVYVDYPTQQRIIKDSGYWYRDTIAKQDIDH